MSSMELYQVGGTEKIRNLEDELARELTDLQNDIEENEMIGGIHKVASSGSLPKNIDHFRKQRELVIKRALEVHLYRPKLLISEYLLYVSTWGFGQPSVSWQSVYTLTDGKVSKNTEI